MKVDQRLKQISPITFAVLSKVRSISGLKKKYKVLHGLIEVTWNIHNFHSCMVGEAYNFEGDYTNKLHNNYCKTCNTIASSFNVQKSDTVYPYVENKIQVAVIKFCNHAAKVHGVVFK